MYPTTNSPIPIVREVQLVLWHAQILMGMGPANYAAALADVNSVRTTRWRSNCAIPPADASSYVTLRNDLLAEQRISTTWEASARSDYLAPHVRSGGDCGHHVEWQGGPARGQRQEH